MVISERGLSFLLAVLQTQMCVHIPADGKSLMQWQKILQKILELAINFAYIGV